MTGNFVYRLTTMSMVVGCSVSFYDTKPLVGLHVDRVAGELGLPMVCSHAMNKKHWPPIERVSICSLSAARSGTAVYKLVCKFAKCLKVSPNLIYNLSA
jgi:hypothetical protein